MSTVAIIQARMSSSRFPGKVVQPLLGVPLIEFMRQRVLQAARVDRVVVATSTDPTDDVLEDTLKRIGAEYFRGSLHDVLDRFYEAARATGARQIVRLTGDCPLVDSDVVDSVVAQLESDGVDYASNVDPHTYPNGLDVECFHVAALERTWLEATEPFDREHVTPFIRRRSDLFRCTNVRGLADMSDLRWTVDYPNDLDLVRELLRRADARKPTDCDRFDFYRVHEADGLLRESNRHARP